MINKTWTDEELDFIRSNRHLTKDEMLYMLSGRTKYGLTKKLLELGIKLPYSSRKSAKYNYWTSAEGLRKVRKLAAQAESQAELARLMGVERQSLSNWSREHIGLAHAQEQAELEKGLRKITDADRDLLHYFVSSFRRVHKLAHERGLPISKAELFVPFIEIYVTQDSSSKEMPRPALENWEPQERKSK